MPAYRSKNSVLDELPSTKKPRAKEVLTDEQRKEKELQKEIRAKRALNKKWKATLVPAEQDKSFKWPLETKGLHKGTAKSLYNLTSKEIETLQAELIFRTGKIYVRLEDVTELAKRKAEFFNQPFKEKPFFRVQNLYTKYQLKYVGPLGNEPTWIRINWFDYIMKRIEESPNVAEDDIDDVL
ncbi:hypothetical protein L218DRAFT_1008369 [Marasmius fiardii PR-910]|nr:hypothetical protein L218DRAFT_1008369 [Marasmius fiardii PR-910]